MIVKFERLSRLNAIGKRFGCDPARSCLANSFWRAGCTVWWVRYIGRRFEIELPWFRTQCSDLSSLMPFTLTPTPKYPGVSHSLPVKIGLTLHLLQVDSSRPTMDLEIPYGR